MEKISNIIKRLTKKQIVYAILLFIIIGICVGGVLVYRNRQTDNKKKHEDIQTSAVKGKKQPLDSKTISFSGTSVDKDLKIKILDEEENLVSGVKFQVDVTSGGGNEKEMYVDEDKDGIIHIEEIAAGKYTVKLQEQKGFVIVENPIVVEVLEELTYEEVDLSGEVKKESEINAKKEDTAINNVSVEKPIANTVPLLESKIIPNKIEKGNISTDNFTKASASEKWQEHSIREINVRVPESIMLFSEDNEASKSYMLCMDISEEYRDIVTHVEWSVDVAPLVEIEKSTDTSVRLHALENGNGNLYVTISYQSEEGAILKRDIQILLSVTDFTDDVTQLKDVNGNGIYLDSNGEQVATIKDYSLCNTFYGTPKYTGWQTIDGKVYYFDEKNQPVKGNHIIGSIRYSFREDGTLIETTETKGIDVSKWQGKIDWRAVANAGIDFAIIRVGYRGSDTGVLVEDPYFKENISGATKAGIKVGVYFFTQAITETEAIEEASMAISLVRGYRLDYPIFIDTERASGGRANSLSVGKRTAIVKAFCRTVQNSGYRPGVYAGRTWYRDNLHAGELELYTIWVAQYNTECTYGGKYDMWQYSDQGSIPGIKGYVDMNICYKGF